MNEESPAVASARPRWNENWISDECEPVAGPDGRGEEHERAAVHGGLRPDVGSRVHDAGGETEAGARGEQRRHRPDREADDDERDEEPRGDGDPRARALLLEPPARETERKTRPRTARPTPIHSRRGSGAPSLALGEHGEEREPAGRDGLNERERRQPKRDDVERPADDADQECDSPAAVPEEQSERAPGMPERQPRQLRGDRVLGDPRPVERRGGQRGRASSPRAREAWGKRPICD